MVMCFLFFIFCSLLHLTPCGCGDLTSTSVSCRLGTGLGEGGKGCLCFSLLLLKFKMVALVRFSLLKTAHYIFAVTLCLFTFGIEHG